MTLGQCLFPEIITEDVNHDDPEYLKNMKRFYKSCSNEGNYFIFSHCMCCILFDHLFNRAWSIGNFNHHICNISCVLCDNRTFSSVSLFSQQSRDCCINENRKPRSSYDILMAGVLWLLNCALYTKDTDHWHGKSGATDGNPGDPLGINIMHVQRVNNLYWSLLPNQGKSACIHKN